MGVGGTGRILVYRLGSIGDFVVALPALHLIRRSYPSAEIGLVTSRPFDARAAAAQTVLDGTGLVDDYIVYSVGTRAPHELLAIRRAIRAFKPDVLIYLAAARGLYGLWRDYLFFRSCGVRQVGGVPFARDLRHNLPVAGRDGLCESEAQRLARCVAWLGDAAPDRAESWDLRLSRAEIAEADGLLRDGLGEAASADRAYVAASIGTKQAINDWGDENWRAVLDAVGRRDLGLVLVGAAAERERSQQVAQGWPGPVVNLCGRASPRVSAAALRRARVFLGHDSGPMHLAASVGTRCIVVFSKLNPPGEWFPFGAGHRVFYPPPEATSIRSIRQAEVIAAAREVLAGEAPRPVRAVGARIDASDERQTSNMSARDREQT